MKKHKAQGDAVVRFEFRNWKRILQTKGKVPWRPVRMSSRAAMARIYREDEKAVEDFTSVAHREDAPSNLSPDAVSGKEQLRNEWLVAVVKEGTHYSLGASVSTMQPDGSVKKEEQLAFFQLIATAHGNHRPKTMTATDPDEDVARNAALAFQIVRKGALPADAAGGAADPTRFVLCQESDPVWVRPGELGPYDSWYKHYGGM